MSLVIAVCRFRNISTKTIFKRTSTPISRLFSINNAQVPTSLAFSTVCYRAVKPLRLTPTSISSLCTRTESTNSKDNSDVTKQHKKRLPTLMEFPEIVWPSVFKSIRNWVLINFIIRPYFDREFTLPDFIAGTKHALQVVSAKIAEGDVSSLTNLVASEAITELKQSISTMSMAQRSELQVRKEDIFLTFPYQVGIMFDESDEKTQKRWVEITMVFHVMRGLKDMTDRGQQPPLNLGGVPEYRDKISICNYRFIKEFTHGIESDWTINIANHFKPSDYIEN